MLLRKIAKKILTKSPKAYTFAHTLNYERKHRQDFSKLDGNEQNILKEIQKNGYAIIPNFFDKEFCDACIKDMDRMYENNKEYIHKSDYADYRIFGAEELSENIKKFSDHKLLNNLANSYNAVPTCCGFTLAGKIEATGHQYGSGGPWHRDSYFRQFKSLIYLTDVDANNGPFQIIRGSHQNNQIAKDTKSGNLGSMECNFNQETIDKILKDDPNRYKTLTAKAGTVVLIDSSAIHRGIPLKTGVRYALTNYFFEKTQINQHLVDHFSPLVNPQKVLSMSA